MKTQTHTPYNCECCESPNSMYREEYDYIYGDDCIAFDKDRSIKCQLK